MKLRSCDIILYNFLAGWDASFTCMLLPRIGDKSMYMEDNLRFMQGSIWNKARKSAGEVKVQWCVEIIVTKQEIAIICKLLMGFGLCSTKWFSMLTQSFAWELGSSLVTSSWALVSRKLQLLWVICETWCQGFLMHAGFIHPSIEGIHKVGKNLEKKSILGWSLQDLKVETMF